MGIIYLAEPGAQACYDSGTMMVKLGTVELLQVPINQIEGIIVYS